MTVVVDFEMWPQLMMWVDRPEVAAVVVVDARADSTTDLATCPQLCVVVAAVVVECMAPQVSPVAAVVLVVVAQVQQQARVLPVTLSVVVDRAVTAEQP
jgi:hypothetical protein